MKKFRKAIVAVMCAAMIISSAFAADTASAAKALKLSTKSVSLTVGKSKTIKVKNAVKSTKVTWKTSSKKIVKIAKKTAKGRKAQATIKGMAAGTAKVTAAYKLGKKKKTLTCKVTVSALEAPVTTQAAIVPTTSATATATAAPTDAVKEATSTPKPTRTPRVTDVPATATPDPTPPAMKDPGAPFELPFVLDGDAPNIVPQGDASVEAADGGVVVTVNTQYSGMAFNVPADMLENNYDTMTVHYKNPVNISGGFGCGIWQDPNNKDTETVAAWGGVFADKDEAGNVLSEGVYETALQEGNVKTWYINKVLFFFNDQDSLDTNGPAKVTITKVVFSNSKYKGGDTPGVETAKYNFVEDNKLEDGAKYILAFNYGTHTTGDVEKSVNDMFANAGSIAALSATNPTTATQGKPVVPMFTGGSVIQTNNTECVWTAEVAEDGSFALKNVSTGKYIAVSGSDIAYTDEAYSWTFNSKKFDDDIKAEASGWEKCGMQDITQLTAADGKVVRMPYSKCYFVMQTSDNGRNTNVHVYKLEEEAK